jgi:hypothetical protein
LLVRAEHKLRSWRIMLPAPGTLERIVNSVVAQATTELFETVAKRLCEFVLARIGGNSGPGPQWPPELRISRRH